MIAADYFLAGGIGLGTIALCFAVNAINSFWASILAYIFMLASLWVAALAGHWWPG